MAEQDQETGVDTIIKLKGVSTFGIYGKKNLIIKIAFINTN